MSVQTSDDVYLAHRDALFGLAYRTEQSPAMRNEPPAKPEKALTYFRHFLAIATDSREFLPRPLALPILALDDYDSIATLVVGEAAPEPHKD